MTESRANSFHLFAALFVAIAAVVVGMGKRNVMPYTDKFPSSVEKNAYEYSAKTHPTSAGSTANDTKIDTKLPLKGFVVAVTGSTSGIGKGIATTTYKLGATVIAFGRNSKKLENLSTELCGRKEDKCDLIPILADNSDLNSIAKCADEIRGKGVEKIDFLINNAGVHYQENMFDIRSQYVTKQGYDLAFGVNYLSHFLLTEKLLPLLGEASSPRVIQVTSTFHNQMDGSDLVPSMSGKAAGSAPFASRGDINTFQQRQRSYANSKLAQLFHARALSRRLKRTQSLKHVKVLSICPGWVATPMAGPVAGLLGYPSNGIGLSSTMNAMFRSDVGGENEVDFIPNFSIPCVATIQSLMSQKWLQGFVRDLCGWFLAFSLLLLNNLLFDDAPPSSQNSSIESFDVGKQEALYEWSMEAVSVWI